MVEIIPLKVYGSKNNQGLTAPYDRRRGGGGFVALRHVVETRQGCVARALGARIRVVLG